MERAKPPPHDSIVVGMHHRLSHHPGEQIAIGHFHEPFEVIKLLGRQMCHLIIRKTAQDQIHLAHPAMPCAEKEPATANV